MIVGILIGAILGLLFFSYKPLFKVLKTNSFSLAKAVTAIREDEAVQRDFQEFSKEQMTKLSRLLAGKKEPQEDSKTEESQEDQESQTQENTQANEADSKDKKD